MRASAACSAALLALLAGCATDPTRPDTPADPGVTVDPGAGADPFVLGRFEGTSPSGEPFAVQLVGTHVIANPADDVVHIDVAVENVGDLELHPPATIWLEAFRPAGVRPLNADIETPGAPNGSFLFGYRYDEALGPDDRLSPGETSASKTWRFRSPDARAFAFTARGEFETEAPGGLSGAVFVDENRNGTWDDHEHTLEGGWHVRVTGPDGEVRITEPAPGGRYAIDVEAPGLHRVELVVEIEPVFCLTTPNPLEVLIPPAPDGSPSSFDDADFGFAFGSCGGPHAEPVTLTELDPTQIEPVDPYWLHGLHVEGDILTIVVGFSGCSPDHPFELFTSPELHWPVPDDNEGKPWNWLVLSHDDLGELCEAAFKRTLRYDLSAMRQQGGWTYDGRILLTFYAADGEQYELIY